MGETSEKHRHSKSRRRALAATLACTGLALAIVAPYAPARSLGVNDTGHLHLLRASGSVLSEEGSSYGTLPGATKVRLDVTENVTASFTISAKGGSISGHGVAALHTTTRFSSFAGTLSVTSGTGRYAHVHGDGQLYGVIERRTDRLTVQAIGSLHY